MWKNIEAAPARRNFGLNGSFQNDDNNQKVNLGVGVYKDDQNYPYIIMYKNSRKLAFGRPNY